jgi:hypothetical protein
MKGIFRTAGMLILILCGGCSTPGQRAAWSAIFQGMANTSQNSFNQYQMNQIQNQQWQQQSEIWNLQHP